LLITYFTISREQLDRVAMHTVVHSGNIIIFKWINSLLNQYFVSNYWFIW